VNITEAIAVSFGSIRAHKLRSFLTLLGLIIGVMTLILVMAIVQGANVYVEEKVANLGTNVFRVSRTPLAVTDFQEFIRAQRNKPLEMSDVEAVREVCRDCLDVGAESTATTTVKAGNEVGEAATLQTAPPLVEQLMVMFPTESTIGAWQLDAAVPFTVTVKP